VTFASGPVGNNPVPTPSTLCRLSVASLRKPPPLVLPRKAVTPVELVRSEASSLKELNVRVAGLVQVQAQPAESAESAARLVVCGDVAQYPRESGHQRLPRQRAVGVSVLLVHLIHGGVVCSRECI